MPDGNNFTEIRGVISSVSIRNGIVNIEYQKIPSIFFNVYDHPVCSIVFPSDEVIIVKNTLVIKSSLQEEIDGV